MQTLGYTKVEYRENEDGFVEKCVYVPVLDEWMTEEEFICLAIAQSAFDLVGPCLQLRSQALVASLQAKGHRVLNQLFFVEQLGNIRSRHAFLYNNQVGAGNGKILIIAINAQPG